MKWTLLLPWCAAALGMSPHWTNAQKVATAQDIYNSLSLDSTLTVRIHSQGAQKSVVYYPNGLMREKYRMTGVISPAQGEEPVWVVFNISLDDLNLDVDSSDIARIQSDFDEWTMTWRPNQIDGRPQLVGYRSFDPHEPISKIQSLLHRTMPKLEAWFTLHVLPETETEPEGVWSDACESMLSILSDQGCKMFPPSLDRICLCADWHSEQGIDLREAWYDCAINSFVMMDPLTPSPMVTCWQPECRIPFQVRGDSLFVELLFPSGQTESLLLHFGDVFLLFTIDQLAQRMEAEHWNQQQLKRHDYTMPFDEVNQITFNHYSLPSFRVGDVTFSAQSVVTPESNFFTTPYLSISLLHALGQWEIDHDRQEILVTPWTYLTP